MLDTLKLRSPELSEADAGAIERWLVTRLGWDNTNKVVLYELVSGSLRGSWESSVSVNVRRKQQVAVEGRTGASGAGVTQWLECVPYIEVEGSVHKAMLGHNVFGGPCDVRKSASWFIGDISRRLGVELPAVEEWQCLRVDWSEVFDVGDFDGCAQYLHGLGIARYPRRQPRRFGDETVMFHGSTTALKFYHKGPEFAKHDFRKVEKTRHTGYAMEVQSKANGYLRVETTIKSRKLKSEYGDHPRIGELKLDWIRDVHDVEVARVLREGKSDMDWVRNNDAVQERLFEFYEHGLATVLYGTWLRLAASGEDSVRASMTVPTFYRHRKQLTTAGVAWDATDVYIRECSAIPAGFRPVRNDSRRLTEEALDVREALLSIA